MPAAALHLELVFSRPETTLSVTRGAARLLMDMGYAPLLEVCLPNGRRADVMALGPKGDIVICEVKSGIEDYRVDRKWPEYAPFCDAFFFAVAPEFPQDVLPDEPGLIVADGFGGAVVRDAPVSPLAPARRKALTLAFARLGALRTMREGEGLGLRGIDAGIPGSGRLAESHGTGGGDLSTNATISERGEIRSDTAGASRGCIGPREHR